MVAIKLDGVRGLLSDRLYSRRNTLITSVPVTPSDIVLDGELYNSNYDFETISGLCRQQYMTPQSKSLVLHVFDQYLEGVPFMNDTVVYQIIRELLSFLMNGFLLTALMIFTMKRSS